jgi:hypothetical protein
VHHRLGPGLYYLIGNMEFLGKYDGITRRAATLVASA